MGATSVSLCADGKEPERKVGHTLEDTFDKASIISFCCITDHPKTFWVNWFLISHKSVDWMGSSFFNPHPRICFYWFWKERKGERERKKHWLVASHMCPDWWLNPQPRYVPWLGIEPSIFWYMGLCANKLSYPARAGGVVPLVWPGWDNLWGQLVACLGCMIQAGLLDLSLGSVSAGALTRPCTFHSLVG